MMNAITPAMQSWGVGLMFFYGLLFVTSYCSFATAHFREDFEDNNSPLPIFACIILAVVCSALTVWGLHAVGFVK